MVEIVWEFQVRPGKEQVFEFHYSPTGTWAVLFGESQKYHGTKLLREAEGTGRYMTVDRWDTRADFLAFRAEREMQYAEIDKQCDALTEIERLVGVFEPV